MATLKEIYAQLEVLITELEDIVENDPNGNKSSDVQQSVLNPIDTAISNLDSIIDDEDAGLYEDDGENDFFEDFEDLG